MKIPNSKGFKPALAAKRAAKRNGSARAKTADAFRPTRPRMLPKSNGIGSVAATILASLSALSIKLDSRLLQGLAQYAAALLHCKSPNTVELAGAMPRKNRREESNWRALCRFLGNPRVKFETVMAPMARALILTQNALRGYVVFMMDQSKIRDGRECLMISIRFGRRAIPFIWIVVDTKGSIGFNTQRKLLNIFCTMLPEGVNVFFTADRFYGFGKLIRYCKKRNWQYRLRMRDNLYVYCDGKRMKTKDIRKAYRNGVKNCRLTTKYGTPTSIVTVWDRKQQEPWIIAMDGEPSKAKARQYGRRWGIESMFSDLKTRGFRITETKLGKPDRIARFLLIAAVAMYFAVSTGMEPAHDPPKQTPEKAKRSRLSTFKTGIRRISTAIIDRGRIPLLWAFIGLLKAVEQ